MLKDKETDEGRPTLSPEDPTPKEGTRAKEVVQTTPSTGESLPPSMQVDVTTKGVALKAKGSLALLAAVVVLLALAASLTFVSMRR